MRLDPDVLAFFRQHGKGYQTTINAVLRRYVEALGGELEIVAVLGNKRVTLQGV